MCRVTIENDTSDNVTVVQVHSADRHGILLNVVQVLTDLDLVIVKSDMFSDKGWFFDGEFPFRLDHLRRVPWVIAVMASLNITRYVEIVVLT